MIEERTEITNSGARCWAITTGEIGMRHQAEGLAGMLDARFQSRTVRLPKALGVLPPQWLFSRRGRLCGSSWWASQLLKRSGLEPPWPDVLVTCGRRSVPFALAMRMVSQGQTMAIHVQHPRVPLSAFDLVILPEHDVAKSRDTERDNVLVMRGAMHHLANDGDPPVEGGSWADLPRPWIGVLLGGKSRAYDLKSRDADVIARQLRASLHVAGGGSLLVIPSRRTSAEGQAEIRKRIGDLPHYFWDGSEANPYRQVLAQADSLCVTRDSVSMLSEACHTGKPVYILRVSGHSNRLASFHASLLSNNHARWLEAFDPDWRPARLAEMEAAVAVISERIADRPSRSLKWKNGGACGNKSAELKERREPQRTGASIIQ